MNEIIKKIEAEQMKSEIPEFHVGDTVKVYAKVIEGSRMFGTLLCHRKKM